MHIRRRKTRRTTMSLLAIFALIAAVSPAVAATNFADVDRNALTLIAIFGTLLFAIVFEVWRLTLRQQD